MTTRFRHVSFIASASTNKKRVKGKSNTATQPAAEVHEKQRPITSLRWNTMQLLVSYVVLYVLSITTINVAFGFIWSPSFVSHDLCPLGKVDLGWMDHITNSSARAKQTTAQKKQRRVSTSVVWAVRGIVWMYDGFPLSGNLPCGSSRRMFSSLWAILSFPCYGWDKGENPTLWS